MISVIIPTYNRAKLLPRAVESVLNQTYQDIELIIVDDGSTDGTMEWIRSIEDERVRYVQLRHQGACAARNHGIGMARGEYIAFQDSDDTWFPDKLEKQLAFLHEKQADVVCSAFSYSGPDGTNAVIWPDTSVQDCRITVEEISRRNLVSTQTILGKKTVFDTIQFDPEMPRLQDWECAIRLAAKYKVYYDSRALAHVYEQPDSISRKPELAIKAAHLFYKKHYEKQLPAAAKAFQEFWKMADEQLITYCLEQRQIIDNQHAELVQVYSEKGMLRLALEQIQKEKEELQQKLMQVQNERDRQNLEL